MNKAELVESVQKALGKETSKAQAERSVEAVVDGIKAGLKKGKSVQLVGFGTFKVVNRKARTGVNPKTGQNFTREELAGFAEGYLGADIIFWSAEAPWLEK